MMDGVERQFPRDLDSPAVAAAFVRVLLDVRSILDPILGARGVAALLQRSLRIASDRFPWLADPFVDGEFVDMPALQASLARQEPATARDGAIDGVFSALHSLLVSLVGAPLTERLFEAAWEGQPHGGHILDIPP
jgi:hypothetical protein